MLHFASRIPGKETEHFYPVESLLSRTFTDVLNASSHDIEPCFYSLWKAMHELLCKMSTSKKNWVCPPSILSGAVLFFLLLFSPEAIIPCVVMLGYCGDDSRYRSQLKFGLTSREVGSSHWPWSPDWTQRWQPLRWTLMHLKCGSNALAHCPSLSSLSWNFLGFIWGCCI